jgi:hypothetical protein
MLNRRHIFRTAVAGLALALTVASAPAVAGSGSVRLRIFSAGFIVGIGGGEGTLRFNGHAYPLRIGGVSVGTIGASGGTLVGRALNLHNPADIVGTFTAVGAGVAVAGGAQVLRMRNSNGVVLELKGMQAGFAANLGVSGFSLSM